MTPTKETDSQISQSHLGPSSCLLVQRLPMEINQSNEKGEIQRVSQVINHEKETQKH